MPNLQLAIPTLHIASIETSLPFYEALGFEVAWQHQLAPDFTDPDSNVLRFGEHSATSGSTP